MKSQKKKNVGPLGKVKSEQVQCMMGLEHVKVFEPDVLILRTGNTSVMDPITCKDNSDEEFVASSTWVRGGA